MKNRTYRQSRKTAIGLLLIPLTILSYFSCGSFDDWSVKRTASTIPIVNPGEPEVIDDGSIVDEEGRLHITRFTITWHFDRNYEYGQFANGDYWVVGPVTITGIDPPSRGISGRTMNGSMLNPSPADSGPPQINYQGYDSSCLYYTYEPSLNVALNVSPSNPLIIQGGSSLLSTVSRVGAGVIPQIQTAAILTVLSSAPNSGSFRPPYSGTDKTVRFHSTQLNYGLLGSLEPVGTTPALATVERYFERPWIDHVPGWTSRITHPLDNMRDYGTDLTGEMSIGAIMLHLNYTDEQKRTLLIRFVQLGIDLFGVVQNGGEHNWPAAGGQASGRKWPILFAGMVLDDADMRNIGQRSGNYLYLNGHGPGNVPPDYIHFGEDDQNFYVTADDVARTHSGLWDPDERNGPGVPYEAGDIGTPEWGMFHASHPYEDNRAWNAIYRQCCASISYTGFILAARVMGANTPALWNHTALFDYQDRYMAVCATADLTPEWRYTTSTYISSVWATNPGWRVWDAFTRDMWDTYRSSY